MCGEMGNIAREQAKKSGLSLREMCRCGLKPPDWVSLGI